MADAAKQPAKPPQSGGTFFGGIRAPASMAELEGMEAAVAEALRTSPAPNLPCDGEETELGVFHAAYVAILKSTKAYRQIAPPRAGVQYRMHVQYCELTDEGVVRYMLTSKRGCRREEAVRVLEARKEVGADAVSLLLLTSVSALSDTPSCEPQQWPIYHNARLLHWRRAHMFGKPSEADAAGARAMAQQVVQRWELAFAAAGLRQSSSKTI